MNLRTGLLIAFVCAGRTDAEPSGIKRLDGSAISFAEAETFAREVLRENGVTGASALTKT